MVVVLPVAAKIRAPTRVLRPIRAARQVVALVAASLAVVKTRAQSRAPKQIRAAHRVAASVVSLPVAALAATPRRAKPTVVRVAR